MLRLERPLLQVCQQFWWSQCHWGVLSKGEALVGVESDGGVGGEEVRAADEEELRAVKEEGDEVEVVFGGGPFQHQEGPGEGANLFHVEAGDGVEVWVGFEGADKGVKGVGACKFQDDGPVEHACAMVLCLRLSRVERVFHTNVEPLLFTPDHFFRFSLIFPT
eukprot:2509047-Rhodomonas_salina.1